jgi:hypothetical protein
MTDEDRAHELESLWQEIEAMLPPTATVTDLIEHLAWEISGRNPDTLVAVWLGYWLNSACAIEATFGPDVPFMIPWQASQTFVRQVCQSFIPQLGEAF